MFGSTGAPIRTPNRTIKSQFARCTRPGSVAILSYASLQQWVTSAITERPTTLVRISTARAALSTVFASPHRASTSMSGWQGQSTSCSLPLRLHRQHRHHRRQCRRARRARRPFATSPCESQQPRTAALSPATVISRTPRPQAVRTPSASTMRRRDGPTHSRWTRGVNPTASPAATPAA